MSQPFTTIHLDATALRVLAHPLRSRLLGSLRMGGPATATALARALDTNTGATSYHLRKLASVGLVEETDEGRGRERWWRAATQSHGWTERDVAGDPGAEAASDWLRRHYLRSFVERYEAWLDESPGWSLDWRAAAESGDAAVRVTAGPAGGVRDRAAGPHRALPRPLPRRSRRPDGRGLPPHDPPRRAEAMTTLDARSARRRYLVLTGLRWLPVGLLLPIFVLVPLSRGLSLTEIGLVFAVQGLVVLALELPTGGLSDALGRRPVLLLAGVVALLSMGLFTIADSVGLFVVAMMLQGVYRALDSGPLEAWYVDATLAADPAAEIERGLGRGTAMLSVAIAIGALASGALVAAKPVAGIDPLLLPLLVALALHGVHLVAVALLMTEVPRARDRRAVAASVRAVPTVIGEGLRLLRSSRVLRCIVLVELFWGFSMVTFESLFPIRLSELVGGTDAAAVILGPVGAAAWFASAAGAAGIVAVSRRIGVARSAAACASSRA